MSARPCFLLGILLGLVLLGPAASAGAHGHVPPRVTLEVGNQVHQQHRSMGEWFGRPGTVQPCPMLIIDPAPSPPPAMEIERGRHRMEIVYATDRRPHSVAIETYRANGEGGVRHSRLAARRDPGGEIYAWEVRFRARVLNELHIFPRAVWRDENDCGFERFESYFRVQAR